MDGVNGALSFNKTNETGSSIIEGVAWCTAYLLEALLITLANSVVIVVFVTDRRLHKSPFYLLVNLAASDLLTGVLNMPLWVYYFGGLSIGWKLNLTGYLPMVMEITETLALFVSLLTLVAIALERMYAITWPFRYATIRRRTYFILIALVWVASAVTVTMFMITVSLWPSKKTLSYRYIILILVCVISILILAAAYSCILIQVTCKEQTNPFCKEEDRRLALTLFLVTMTAILTWLPYILVFFMKVNGTTKRLVLFFNYSNALINPLLYTLRTTEFRKAVLKLLCRKSLA